MPTKWQVSKGVWRKRDRESSLDIPFPPGSHFLTAARRVAFVRTRGSLKLRLSKVQRALTLRYGCHGKSPFPICLTLAEKTGSRNYDF